MTRHPLAFHLRLLLTFVVVLGGCPSSAPPMPSKISNSVQCKTGSDRSVTTQTITWGVDSLVVTAPPPSKADAPTSIVVTVRGQPYLAVEVAEDVKSKRITATAHFGKAFSGVREMVLTTDDGGETLSGTLDGKKLKPFAKNAPAAFADGSPMPTGTVDEATDQELTTFLKAVEGAPHTCQPTAANRTNYFEQLLERPEPAQERTLEASAVVRGSPEGGVDSSRSAVCEGDALVMRDRGVKIGGGIEPDVSIDDRLLFADAARGHHYNPDNAGACITCWTGCIGITAWCVAASLVVCAALFPPPPLAYAMGICHLAGIIACFATGRLCRIACLAPRPGLCCPTDCGTGACCDTNDSCLDPAPTHDVTTCCPADHPQACGRRVCCLDSTRDVCIESSAICCPVGTTCCAPGMTVCGTRCCPGACNGETGQCCAAGESSCGRCGSDHQPCCTTGAPCGAATVCVARSCVACPPPFPPTAVDSPPNEFAGHSCLVGLDYVKVYGRAHCDAGSQRDRCVATVVSSNDDRAFCHARWQVAGDPNNCLCEVHFQVPTNCNGGLECSIEVTERRPSPPLPPGCPRP